MYRLLACVSVLAAPLLSVAAPHDQPQAFSCASRPDEFVDLDDSSSVWPVGKVVVLEGFVGSVQQDAQSTRFSIKANDSAENVQVLAPAETDVAGFGEDYVRVQGLATTLRSGAEGGIRAVHLIGRDPTHRLDHKSYGGIMACPPPTQSNPLRTRARKLSDAGPCGAEGQRVCVGDELDDQENGWECDPGFVAGAGSLCEPWTPDATTPPDDGDGDGDGGGGSDCGGSGEPICTGDDLVGRENGWECDFGFVAGPDGTCIPYVAPGDDGEETEGPPADPEDDPPDVPSGADDCGGDMEPICVGDQLLDQENGWECNPGFVAGPADLCMPWTPLPEEGAVCGGNGEPTCKGEQLAARDPPWECDQGFVGRITETNGDGVCVPYEVDEILEDPPPAPAPPPPTCGQGGQPVCTGDELEGRTSECDFGFVPGEEEDEGICVAFMPDPPAECGTDFEPIASDGSFGPVIPLPIIPVATALLPSGQVLSWSGFFADQFGINGLGSTKWVIFDPSDDSSSAEMTSMTDHDMFCPSISMLPDGRIVVGGGNNAEATSIYTDGVGWEATAQMNIPRGYSSAVTLSNGQVFTNGGSWSGDDIQNVGCCINKGAEVYNPATGEWRLLTSIDSLEMLCDDPEGRQQQDYYGFFFAWTGATVFHAGPSTQMNWYTTDGTGSSVSAGNRGPTAQNGCAVMYDAGKILVVGGGPAFGLSLPSRTTAEVVTLSGFGSFPEVEDIMGPLNPRTFSMAVVLPTGDVLHFGGNGISEQFSDDDALLQPELWNHESQQWQLLETPMAVARTYHSSSVLVPDGRIYIGGGGLCFTCFPGQSGKICDCLNNHLDAEMYSPPYLFNTDGSPADRPTVAIDQTTVDVGGQITVTSNEPMLQVSMLRMGSSTHSVNLDQRRLELCGNAGASCNCDTEVTLTIPGEGIAIPGYWMMFTVNAAGVPSVGEIFQVV